YDNMLRLTQGNHPDGGQTVFNYPNPTSVERQHKISSGSNAVDDYFAYFDGLGRTTRTQHGTPSGNVYADTTYDSLGRAASGSNPYYQTADPTYGTAQSQHDGLGRILKLVKPDNSASTVLYADNCTTATDEAGKVR